MSEAKERWLYSYPPRKDIVTGHVETLIISDRTIARFTNEGDARHACAAVNACAGIATEALEAGVVKELVEALEDAAGTLQVLGGPPVEHPVLTKVRAVLAKART